VHLRLTVVDHIGALTYAVDKTCREGRGQNHGFMKLLRVSQRHISGPKVGKNQITFRSPDMCMCI
jgi:hypothetical protein